MKIVSTKGPSRSAPELGPFRALHRHHEFFGLLLGEFPGLSHVNDADAGIIQDAIGADPPDRESRVDRRTACLQQADAFREKALADPENHDQWIDEAIKWLERAREAGCRAAITVERGDSCAAPESVRAVDDPDIRRARDVIVRQ
ncbi:hypothetical protein AB8Z38_04900 [Bradyrhizobium sp. LLZ17]|uniref:Uncharacterized protein n=1 Tax=Bradyrhizobium sp. LLZ17 TaxID=3239388 RepID=A0AB39XQ88_9BRAD